MSPTGCPFLSSQSAREDGSEAEMRCQKWSRWHRRPVVRNKKKSKASKLQAAVPLPSPGCIRPRIQLWLCYSREFSNSPGHAPTERSRKGKGASGIWKENFDFSRETSSNTPCPRPPAPSPNTFKVHESVWETAQGLGPASSLTRYHPEGCKPC